MSQLNLFETENILSKLSKHGDPLEAINKAIPWNSFKPLLEKIFLKDRKSNAGRPSFDYLMMFKVLILQNLYNLSDAQTQYQILDRYSFKRFIGIHAENKVPDEKTIWHFREELGKRNGLEELFSAFNKYLTENGFSAKKGMIVDASIVEVPRQRNTREENEMIKSGKVPSEWKENEPKLRQKDIDAAWLQKNGETSFGYKNHICIDNKNKLIREFVVTPANIHDSECITAILDEKNSNQQVWADSAYRSESIEETLKRCNIKSNINTKGCRNKKLSEFQRLANKKRSKIRSRVEHVFGRISAMRGNFIRSIGKVRAEIKIGLINLTYNMTRYEYLIRGVKTV